MAEDNEAVSTLNGLRPRSLWEQFLLVSLMSASRSNEVAKSPSPTVHTSEATVIVRSISGYDYFSAWPWMKLRRPRNPSATLFRIRS